MSKISKLLPVVLIAILLISFSAIFTQVKSTTLTLGDTKIEGNSFTRGASLNTFFGETYALPVASQINQLYVYCSMSAPGNSVGVIYDSNGTLICNSSIVNVGTSNTWVVFPFTTGNNVSARSIVIGILSDTDVNEITLWMTAEGSASQVFNSSDLFSTSSVPNHMVFEGTITDQEFSAYIEYTDLSTIGASPSPTSTTNPNPTPPPHTNSFNPPIHVNGNHIIDSQGNTVVFTGWNKNGFEDYPQGSWQDATGAYSYGVFTNSTITANLQAMHNYGANFMRVISLSMYALNPTDLNFIAQLAQLCSAQGIYLDYCLGANNHSESFPTACSYEDAGNGYINTPADFVNMWGNVSNTLKAYPNVVLELWNEANPNNIPLWTSTVQATVNNIRSTGCNNSIINQFTSGIYKSNFAGGGYSDLSWVDSQTNALTWKTIPVGGFTWENGAGVMFAGGLNYTGAYGTYASDPQNINGTNIIESTHIYYEGNFLNPNYSTDYSVNDFQIDLEMSGVYAVASTHPLIVGEHGEDSFISDQSGPLTLYNWTTNNLLANGIGVCQWWWYPVGSGFPYDTLTGGANYALTTSGQVTSDDYLAFGSTTPTPTPSPSITPSPSPTPTSSPTNTPSPTINPNQGGGPGLLVQPLPTPLIPDNINPIKNNSVWGDLFWVLLAIIVIGLVALTFVSRKKGGQRSLSKMFDDGLRRE